MLSLEPATQALQVVEGDTDMLDSLLSNTHSRSRQNTNLINDKRKQRSQVSQALSFSLGDLYHTFEGIKKKMNDNDIVHPLQNVSSPATYNNFDIKDDLQPSQLSYNISPALFETWQESLQKWFYSGYGKEGSNQVFHLILLNKLNKQWRMNISDSLSGENSINLNIDIIRQTIYHSHPVFSRRVALFNIHQNPGENASDLLDRIILQERISDIIEMSKES